MVWLKGFDNYIGKSKKKWRLWNVGPVLADFLIFFFPPRKARDLDFSFLGEISGLKKIDKIKIRKPYRGDGTNKFI